VALSENGVPQFFFLMPKMHHSKPVQTTIYPPFWTFISIIENNSHKLDAPRFLLVFNSHLCPQTLQAMFFMGVGLLAWWIRAKGSNFPGAEWCRHQKKPISPVLLGKP
jgi:hypothetical protein